MPCSMRPWTTTGLVLTGAGLVVVNPIARTAPLLDISQGPVQLLDSSLPFPLVDWTQFSANTSTTFTDIANAIGPGFTPNFDGLSNHDFYSLAAMLIEGGMALKVALSPSAAGQAISGVTTDLQTAFANHDYAAVFKIITNTIPTVVNGYANGIAPVDGVLNAGLTGPPIPDVPPYSSGILMEMLVKTITDQSNYLADPGGTGTLTDPNLPLLTWAGAIPPTTTIPDGAPETAGNLYLDIPQFLTWATTGTGPLAGIATSLGIAVDGNNLDMNIPTAADYVLTHILSQLATDFGLTIPTTDPNNPAFGNLDMAIPVAVNYAVTHFLGSLPSQLGISVPQSGSEYGNLDIFLPTTVNYLLNGIFHNIAQQYGLSVSGSGENWQVNYNFDISKHNISGHFAIPGDVYLPIGTEAAIPIGGIVPLASFPNPAVELLKIGDITTGPNGLPLYDLDLAKDLLALFGSPTDPISNLDINSLLGTDLGLSFAGGGDPTDITADGLHINIANVLAELLNVFFPPS